MPTFRTIKTDCYSIIDNGIARDPDLSWKAKGILMSLLTLPDDWVPRLIHLQNVSTDGRDATASGINELIQAGYILKNKIRNSEGQFIDWEYIIRENKLLSFEQEPKGEEPKPENPNSVMPTLLNNNNTNTISDKLNNKHTKNSMDITKEVISYLNNKVKKNFRVVDPVINLVRHRLKEGYTEDDFKRVIDSMYLKWGKDDKMCDYLRPITLFGTKFDTYLNAFPKKEQEAPRVAVKQLVYRSWQERDEALEANVLQMTVPEYRKYKASRGVS